MLYTLLEELKTGLEALFDDTAYEQPTARAGRQPRADGEEAPARPPVICIGDLPPKRGNDNAPDDYPYILIRLPSGQTSETDGERTHSATVRLVCGSYTTDGSEAAQHHTSLQMHYRVLQWLCQNGLIGKKWVRQLPLPWGLGASGDRYSDGSQPKQYSVSWIEARYETRAEVDNPSPDELRAYGS